MLDSNSKYAYSEIFYSIQGEGKFTGIPTLWLRYFLCNLQCDGFGQKDPTNPDTYKLPYKEFNVEGIHKIKDLPVWKFGCDSSYSWSKKFAHLQNKKTPKEIADALEQELKNGYNPTGKFLHPLSGQEQHMCFTGGEPLMKHAQICTFYTLDELKCRGNQPKYITFETNGTQPLEDITVHYLNTDYENTEIFFSVSPKLFTVTGEDPRKAIRPDNVATYSDVLGADGQLKFVIGNERRQWDELDEVVNKFRKAGVSWPVWIMPVGATEESQLETAGDVASMAYQRGYNVSARVHCYLWGNKIGV